MLIKLVTEKNNTEKLVKPKAQYLWERSIKLITPQSN